MYTVSSILFTHMKSLFERSFKPFLAGDQVAYVFEHIVAFGPLFLDLGPLLVQLLLDFELQLVPLLSQTIVLVLIGIFWLILTGIRTHGLTLFFELLLHL